MSLNQSKTNIVAALLCRVDSSRLPAKVLMTLGNRSVIEHIYDAIRVNMNIIPVVTTTVRECDEPIVRLCALQNLNIHRGSEYPLRRLQSVLEEFDAEYVFRVNCDSPFVDLELLERALRMTADNDLHVVTNLMPRSFPYGITSQLIRRDCLKDVCDATPDELEHVTPYLERKICQGSYAYMNISSHMDKDSIANFPRLTIDTLADFIFVSNCLLDDGSLPNWRSLLLSQ
jgi:spore coat polysaccharide biosynthesis protein SpsF (cytidylyltransferase family)